MERCSNLSSYKQIFDLRQAELYCLDHRRPDIQAQMCGVINPAQPKYSFAKLHFVPHSGQLLLDFTFGLFVLS